MDIRLLPEKGRGIFMQTTRSGGFLCLRFCYAVIEECSSAKKEGYV